MSDLSKRAVACKHWRWMPGMRDSGGRTLQDFGGDTGLRWVGGHASGGKAYTWPLHLGGPQRRRPIRGREHRWDRNCVARLVAAYAEVVDDATGLQPRHPEVGTKAHNDFGVSRPDLDDPATLGCIEHGLLPACGYNDAHIDTGADREGSVLYYVVYRPDPISHPSWWLSACENGTETKAEALIAALEGP